MDGLTESRKVWRFEGKIQFQKTKTERRKSERMYQDMSIRFQSFCFEKQI